MLNKRIKLIDFITILGLIMTGIFIIYGFETKLFVSYDALQGFLQKFGIFAVIAFVLVQAVQVVVPIIPGALGCLAGVVIFGPWQGFLYNYLGICLGSIIAFFLSRHYGIGLVEKLSSKKLLNKYRSWLTNDKFDKWFAIAIFLPVAPDDFLCYLAGITRISVKKFCMIIFTCKPFAIVAYSMGLNLIFTTIIHYIIPLMRS
jgi:uncharacterized membrane protein YdjX (TVP38/TMEM64 family)